jgi:chromosome segregation ATPase
VEIDLTRARDEQESLRGQLQEVQDILANRSSATEAEERDVALLQAQLRETELHSTIKQLQDEIESNDSVAKLAGEAVEAEDARLRGELERLQAEHASSVETVASLQSTIVELEHQMKQATSDAAETYELSQRLKDVEAKLASVSETEQKRGVDLEAQLANIQELERQIDDQNRMLEFAELEYEMLLASSQAPQKTHESAGKALQERISATNVKAEEARDQMASSFEQAKSSMLDEQNKLRANLSALDLTLQESVDSVRRQRNAPRSFGLFCTIEKRRSNDSKSAWRKPATRQKSSS